MNGDGNNLSTPKRLGLRRSCKMPKNINTGSHTKHRILENENSVSTPKTRLLQSDKKINYKNLEKETSQNSSKSKSSPSTPNSVSTTDLQRLAVSTNCRPYRLALSRKVREKMTKKRLEFFLANEIDVQESVENQTENELQPESTIIKGLSTQGVVVDQLETAEKELKAHLEHLKKVEELRDVINIWKAGFSSALHDLQEKIKPRLETEALLEHLRIPQEMIKYIND